MKRAEAKSENRTALSQTDLILLSFNTLILISARNKTKTSPLYGHCAKLQITS